MNRYHTIKFWNLAEFTPWFNLALWNSCNSRFQSTVDILLWHLWSIFFQVSCQASPTFLLGQQQLALAWSAILIHIGNLFSSISNNWLQGGCDIRQNSLKHFPPPLFPILIVMASCIWLRQQNLRPVNKPLRGHKKPILWMSWSSFEFLFAESNSELLV